jgi:diacylglycerol kinase (ATP)
LRQQEIPDMKKRIVVPLAAELITAFYAGFGKWRRGHLLSAVYIAVGALGDAAVTFIDEQYCGVGLGLAFARTNPAMRLPALSGLVLSKQLRLNSKKRLAWAFLSRGLMRLAEMSALAALPDRGRRFDLIVNSDSGSVRLASKGIAAAHRLRAVRMTYVVPSQDLGMAIDKISDTPVMAIGGDGTVGSIAEGALDRNLPIAIVAAGTGNDIARGLGLPLGPLEAALVALTGKPTLVDVGDSSFGRFLHAANVGMVSQFASLVVRTKGRWRPVVYPLMALRAFRNRVPFKASLSIDGQSVALPDSLIQLSVLATARLGGRVGVNLADDLSRDGKLTVLVLPTGALREVFAELIHLLRIGRRKAPRRSLIFEGKEVDLSTKPEMAVSRDGEPCGSTPLHFEVSSKPLTVFVPPASCRRRALIS